MTASAGRSDIALADLLLKDLRHLVTYGATAKRVLQCPTLLRLPEASRFEAIGDGPRTEAVNDLLRRSISAIDEPHAMSWTGGEVCGAAKIREALSVLVAPGGTTAGAAQRRTRVRDILSYRGSPQNWPRPGREEDEVLRLLVNQIMRPQTIRADQFLHVRSHHTYMFDRGGLLQTLHIQGEIESRSNPLYEIETTALNVYRHLGGLELDFKPLAGIENWTYTNEADDRLVVLLNLERPLKFGERAAIAYSYRIGTPTPPRGMYQVAEVEMLELQVTAVLPEGGIRPTACWWFEEIAAVRLPGKLSPQTELRPSSTGSYTKIFRPHRGYFYGLGWTWPAGAGAPQSEA